MPACHFACKEGTILSNQIQPKKLTTTMEEANNQKP
jgi:hypothetical protein